ncbi:MAG TPA: gamma-glutamyltransferase [Nitriliruptorales bacterium]
MTALDPRSWPVAELAHYQDLSQRLFLGEPAYGSRDHAIILGSTGPLAQLAARKALEAGGTIVDAAITMALTQTTLAMGSWVSFAGIFNMVLYEAQTGQVHSLNGGYATFRDEHDPLSIPRQPEPSGRSALVPGFFAAIQAAHDRWGRLPWADLFEPALYVAEEGFEVAQEHVGLFAFREDVLERTEEGRAIFLDENGELPGLGATFRQPALAATLRAIARDGADHVYRGPWAQRFVEIVNREGGKASLEDLAEYRPLIGAPLRTTYRDVEVATLAGERGGVALCEALNLAELADLGDPTTSGEALFWMVQIARQAMGSLLDPPDERRATKEHAREVWKEMSNVGHATLDADLEASLHSDFIAGVDEDGNVLTLLHSVNTSMWGTTGIFVDGIGVPDSGAIQPELIAKVGPGALVPNVSEPAIFLRDGKPVLASSIIGTGMPDVPLQCLTAILDRGMTPAQAISRPLFHGPSIFSKPDRNAKRAEPGDDGPGDEVHDPQNGTVSARASSNGATSREKMYAALRKFDEVPQVLETGFDEEVLDDARGRGLAIEVKDPRDGTIPRGFWIGVSIDPDTGRLHAARTRGTWGVVEGY